MDTVTSEVEHFNQATRFAALVADAADESHVIDLLLSIATPKSDREGLAAKLISRFGSLPRIMAAPAEELADIDGVGNSGAFLIKLVHLTAQRALKPDFKKPIKINEISEVMAYLQIIMRYEQRETFRILFLNRKNYIIDHKLMSEGTLDGVPVFRREVLKCALALGAAALILVHNHPSGDPTPSECDVSETLRLREACEIFDIKIHDHFVLGNGTWSSFRSLGYL